MTQISIALVAALSLAAVGCKQKGGDCSAAIAHSMELSKAAMAKLPGFDDTMAEKMRALGVQHCTDDKWPAEAITCMTAAKTMADAQGCYGKLTADQRDKMNKAAMEMSPPPAGAGTDHAGSAATGSDTGATGSAEGSAAAPEAGSDKAAGGSAGSAAAPK